MQMINLWLHVGTTNYSRGNNLVGFFFPGVWSIGLKKCSTRATRWGSLAQSVLSAYSASPVTEADTEPWRC